MVKTFIGVMAISVVTGLAAAQTCGTLTGGSNCAAPARGGPIDFSKSSHYDDPRDRMGSDALTPFSGMGSIGSELSGNYVPATVGAITFGGVGTRCSGLFRSHNC